MGRSPGNQRHRRMRLHHELVKTTRNTALHRADAFRQVQFETPSDDEEEKKDKKSEQQGPPLSEPNTFFPGDCSFRDMIARDSRRFRKALPTLSELTVYDRSSNGHEVVVDTTMITMEDQVRMAIDSLPKDVMKRIERDYSSICSSSSVSSYGNIHGRGGRYWSDTTITSSTDSDSCYSKATFYNDDYHDDDNSDHYYGYSTDDGSSRIQGSGIRELYERGHRLSLQVSKNFGVFKNLMAAMNRQDVSSDSDDDDDDDNDSFTPTFSTRFDCSISTEASIDPSSRSTKVRRTQDEPTDTVDHEGTVWHTVDCPTSSSLSCREETQQHDARRTLSQWGFPSLRNLYKKQQTTASWASAMYSDYEDWGLPTPKCHGLVRN